MSDIRSWVGLSLVPNVGPVMSRRLLAGLGSPDNIFSASPSALSTVPGLGRERAQEIREFRLWDAVDKIVKAADNKGITILHFDDPRYPSVLKEIEGSPVVLYMKGDYLPEDRFGIAVVGSRRHTEYGQTVTRKIAGDLASSGLTIVSGMARGIDTLSHTSALSAGGRTIAVLGSGIDVSYPPENKGLIQKIASSGCVLTEFPPGTMPNRENFPRRNRIISGLSLGVLVIEATADSGSLITAEYALEQNKDVFAVPGSITSPSSEGTNKLIKAGAKMVLDAGDVIEELAPLLKGFIRSYGGATPEITAAEQGICSVLTREPKHIDQISRETAAPVNRLLELLLSLELKGVVRQAVGMQFYLS